MIRRLNIFWIRFILTYCLGTILMKGIAILSTNEPNPILTLFVICRKTLTEKKSEINLLWQCLYTSIHIYLSLLIFISLHRYQYWGHISSRLSSNSEAFASELLDNLEEMFLRFYIYSSSNFKSATYSIMPVVSC